MAGEVVALAVAGRGSAVRSLDGGPFDELVIEGYPVRCGFVTVPEPAFEPDGQHRSHALVDVRAFSCNYRDKALILRMSVIPADRGFYVIGSELAGRVIAVGEAVRDLAPGDRVMVDGCFGAEVRPWGLPTNHASRSRQVLPASKLMRVPDAMSDEEAAAFSIGGQTSSAMVRRAGLRPGDEVLVTAGTSNTSLFLLQAAAAAGAVVSVATTSGSNADTLSGLGAAEVFVIEADGPGFDKHPGIGARAKKAAGFRAVLDPYFDLYLERSLPVLASWGSYVSCGLERQFPRHGSFVAGSKPKPVLHDGTLANCLGRNVSLVMNCLGSTEDLRVALDRFARGRLRPVIDSVVGCDSGGAAGSFVSRTFCERGRLGKVVARHGPDGTGSRP
jgi:NADPH:quinone reductase-like Zn-dependent oxidoreductase